MQGGKWTPLVENRNTKHFPLNLQSNAALSKLRNFGGLNTLNPPLGTPLVQNEARVLSDTVFLPRVNSECGKQIFVYENSLDAVQQFVQYLLLLSGISMRSVHAGDHGSHVQDCDCL